MTDDPCEKIKEDYAQAAKNLKQNLTKKFQVARDIANKEIEVLKRENIVLQKEIDLLQEDITSLEDTIVRLKLKKRWFSWFRKGEKT